MKYYGKKIGEIENENIKTMALRNAILDNSAEKTTKEMLNTPISSAFLYTEGEEPKELGVGDKIMFWFHVVDGLEGKSEALVSKAIASKSK